MWEAFDPRNGEPMFRSRCKVLVRLYARFCIIGGDYARAGDGWI